MIPTELYRLYALGTIDAPIVAISAPLLGGAVASLITFAQAAKNASRQASPRLPPDGRGTAV
ncbi:hypothetical protein ACMHYB_30195 [Sorangium sp. So ce1128]